MPRDQGEHVVYGFTPDRPVAFTVPPVEARPDQPLPESSAFLRVCEGAEEPSTVLLRCAGQVIGVWRYLHEQRPSDTSSVDEQLNLLIWLIDREASGHIRNIAVAPEAPISPSSYGDWVAWLAWKYALYALRQDDPRHHEWDATELECCVEALDELVADVRAGRVRLRATAGAFPPKGMAPDAGGTS
ncbi:hypothetical protein [Nocardia sp. BMG51109]|uniref:hypothetical protein n=1 Tax=Nocardia sp. BMG51109 TaxID=1056816 RepID=UPI0012EB2E18|nr:hypothetical protein [Nocardia sp. BMG51109]